MNVPALHDAQNVKGGVDVVPSSHVLHSVNPGSEVYAPAVQSAHCFELASKKRPGSQGVQDGWPWVDSPSVQNEHEV